MYKILANTVFLGKDFHYLPECHSTNDTAFQLVREGKAGEGSLILSDHQLGGKGQRGNHWESDAGKNLTFSLVFQPDFLDITEQFYINMAISCAIRDVLSAYFPGVTLKWPNDLIVVGKGKLGGVLIENSIGSKGWEFSIVGIGINCNQLTFVHPGAVSLKSLSSMEFDRNELLKLVAKRIETYYLNLKKGDRISLRKEYIENLFLFGEWTTYELLTKETIHARIIGVNSFGQLELEIRNGKRMKFNFQEIRFPDYVTSF